MSEDEKPVSTGETATPAENAEPTVEPVVEPAEPTEPPAEIAEPPKEEKNFTQAEVDRIVQSRLARERRYLRPEQPHTAIQTQPQTQTPETRQKPNPQAINAQGQPIYQTYEAYLEDLSDWKAEQKLTEFQARNQQQVYQQQFQQAARDFEARANEARTKYEDFDMVALDDNLAVTQAMSTALMESEQGPEILYYLGNNPKEAMRISRLSPTTQIREIGKIEAKVSQPASIKPKPSTAPKPIQPVNTAKAQVSIVPEDNQDMGTWMAKRQEQIKGRRR